MSRIVNIYRKLPVSVKRQLTKLYKYIPMSSRTVLKNIDGAMYELDLSRLVHAQMYYYNYWEEHTTNYIKEHVKPGMIVFDIGASSGVHTLRFAKQVGINGKVYAFEPSEWMYNALKRGIKLNDFENIVAENIALSNVTEKGTFNSTEHGRLDKKTIEEKQIDIQFMRLDDYVGARIKQIDLIKLDVDGWETKILQGSRMVLAKFKPEMIIEFGRGEQEKFGNSIHEMVDLLKSFGYKFYKENTLEEVGDIISTLPKEGTINIICKGGKNDGEEEKQTSKH